MQLQTPVRRNRAPFIIMTIVNTWTYFLVNEPNYDRSDTPAFTLRVSFFFYSERKLKLEKALHNENYKITGKPNGIL